MGREDYPRTGLPAIPEEPSPWAGGPEHVLWFDPHVSRQLLHSHAERSFDASRPPRVRARSVAFVRRKLAAAGILPTPGEGNPPLLLDLACGPGYHVEALAGAGFHVLGVDGNNAAIAEARRRAQTSDYPSGGRCSFQQLVVAEDFPQRIRDLMAGTDATEERPLAAALMLYGTWLTLAPWVRGAVLAGLQDLLVPGGLVIVDLYSRLYLRRLRNSEDPLLRGGGQSWRSYPKGGFWSAEPHTLIRQNLDYGPGGPFLQRYLMIPQEQIGGGAAAPRTGTAVAKQKEFRVWHDVPDRKALKALCEHYGFRLRTRRMLRGAQRGILDWRWAVMERKGDQSLI